MKSKHGRDDGAVRRLNWRFLLAILLNIVVWTAIAATVWRCSRG